jgi:hypothetical protein
MIDVSIHNDELDLSITGIDRLLSLSSGFEIPLSHIRAVGEDTVTGRRAWNGLRSPGTGIPGFLSAGRYRHDGTTDFLCVRHPGPALAIDLDDERFNRIVVGVADVERSVGEIRQALDITD